MTRRECLTRLFGAAVAVTLAPLIDLTDTTPAFWNQAPLQELLQWRVVLPDGMSWSFSAQVVSERIVDGELVLDVRPSGPMVIEQTAYTRSDSVLEGIGKTVTLEDIELPQLILDDDPFKGIKRTGNITFKLGKFL